MNRQMTSIAAILATLAALPTVAQATSLVGRASPPIAFDEGTYFEQWCRDLRAVLARAAEDGSSAPTFEEEKIVLRTGIAEALRRTSPKEHRYVANTLQAGLDDVGIYPNDLERQVMVLRRAIRYALEDLYYFSGRRLQEDHGPYVFEMLGRVLSDGVRTPENAEEISILVCGSNRAIVLLDSSDHRRTPRYACARMGLSDALALVADPGLSEMTRIQILRRSISQAIGSGGACIWN